MEPVTGHGQSLQASKTLKHIRKTYGEIKPDLARVEAILKETLQSRYSYIDGMLDHMTRFAGKRIRPALLLFCARLTGKVTEAHQTLGAAVEMLHNATLVHDDVLDEALLRRKIHTINRGWDNEQAIIFGDFVFARTFSLIASLGDADAFQKFTDAALRICSGELLQLSRKYQAGMTESEYFEMIELKTASLFEASCILGTAGQKAPDPVRKALGEYGRNLGVAFQVVDDCLDIVGQENIMGKSLGTDITKGKVTLPIIRLLRTLPKKDAAELRTMIARVDHEQEKRREIARLVRERSLIEPCMETARNYIWNARKALEPVPEGTVKQALNEITEFVIDRVN